MGSTDWVTEGAQVAIYSVAYYMPRVTLTTVERFTATQVVCVNGARFRRDTGSSVGEGRAELRPVDDPQVRNVYARQRLSDLRHHIDTLTKSVVDANGGVNETLAALDKITRQVGAVRAAIGGRS